MRWAWAEVDLGVIVDNVTVVRDAVSPAKVFAVVKADGYGHGALGVAIAALGAGADGLCVALVTEAVELRRGGVLAQILLLSEQPPAQAGVIVENDLTPTVYSRAAIEAIAVAAENAGRVVDVHLKIDTGMHRVGCDPDEAVALVAAISAAPHVRLGGIFTHLACADEPTAPDNDLQLRRFEAALAAVRAAGYEIPMVHAANSAAALSRPNSRYDMVRLGVAMYGIVPGSGVAGFCNDLRPSLSLHARVSMVKRVAAGERISYGLRHVFAADSTIATIPIGYADGVPRRLFGNGGEVLIHGRRMPIVGVVTMDQMMVDCGSQPVAVGDEVVLIGAQRSADRTATIRAEDWAERLGTIGYEIVCGISKRIERLLR